MLASAIRDIKALEPRQYEGRVTALEGLRIEAAGPQQALRLGASVRFGAENGPRGELVGFEGDKAILLACDPLDGLGPGAPVYFTSGLDAVRPSEALARPRDRCLCRTARREGPAASGHARRGLCAPFRPTRRRARALIRRWRWA